MKQSNIIGQGKPLIYHDFQQKCIIHRFRRIFALIWKSLIRNADPHVCRKLWMRHTKPSLQCKSNSSRRTHFNPENHTVSPRLGMFIFLYFSILPKRNASFTETHNSPHFDQHHAVSPFHADFSSTFPCRNWRPRALTKKQRERTRPGATRDVDKKSGKKSQRFGETAPSWRNKVRPKRIDATLRGDAADRQTTQGQLKTYCGIVRRAASSEWTRAGAPRVNHMVRWRAPPNKEMKTHLEGVRNQVTRRLKTVSHVGLASLPVIHDGL